MFQFYLSLTFWLMVALLEAFAIFKLWEAVVRPRWINLVLLPGTIVAETAHFLAALLTGAPIRDAKLVSDDPIGQPAEGGGEKGIPVLSPLLLALLPIMAGVAAIYALYAHFDDTVVRGFAAVSGETIRNGTAFGSAFGAFTPLQSQLTQELTWRLSGWFQLARDVLSLAERLIDALPFHDITATWKSWLFIYLTACLAVRMVPLRGNLRSGMAAVILVGAVTGGLGYLMEQVHKGLRQAWPLLAYMVALLTLVLLTTLLIRGLIALVFVLANKPQPTRGG